MREEQRLKTFLRILGEYPGETPLSKFLPAFFRANPKMGSQDRRMASRLVYNFFRLGKAASDLSPEQRLFLGEFLCSSSPSPFLQHFRPELDEKAELPLADKIALLERETTFRLEDVFPFHKHISKSIDQEKFLQSFFIQPDLFIRVIPGKEAFVREKLSENGVPFTAEDKFGLRLPNGTRLDHIFSGEKPFEVQDLSSQQTGAYYRPQKYDYWWDACAASGGKSLLLHQLEPSIKLLVSDVRESILGNLDERFLASGIRQYQKKLLDLSKDPSLFLHDFFFDGVILDAPCTGSGTWGRSPEMISQFREGRIQSFQHLQQSIARNVLKFLKPGKPLIFITCSAFHEENEANVQYLVDEFKMQLKAQVVLKGYEHKADTMFVSRLIR